MRKQIFIFLIMVSFKFGVYGQSEFSILDTKVTSDLWDISFTSADTGWAVGANTTLLQTTDSGKTWVSIDIESKIAGSYNGLTINRVYAISDTKCKLTAFHIDDNRSIEGFLLFSTNDFGLTWQEETFESNGLIFIPETNISFSFDFEPVYRARDSGSEDTTRYVIKKSTDGGISYEDSYIKEFGLSWGSTSTTFDYKNGILYFLTRWSPSQMSIFTYNIFHVIYSTDLGITWHFITSTDDNFPSTTDFFEYTDITFIDSNSFYLAYNIDEAGRPNNGGNLDYTGNGGVNWISKAHFGNDFGNISMDEVEINETALFNDEIIFATKYELYKYCNNVDRIAPLYNTIEKKIYDIEVIDTSTFYISGQNGLIVKYQKNEDEIINHIREINNNTLGIYPIPTKDFLFFEDHNIKKVEVYNIKGELVLSELYTSESINISDLKNGVYFLKIQSNRSIETRKVIKQ